MSPKSKSRGLELIDSIIPARLHPEIMNYAFSKIGRFEKKECKLQYTEYHNEVYFWGLGFLCLEWTLGILKQKSEEGHCNAHEVPCTDASSFHSELYQICKKSIKELILTN